MELIFDIGANIGNFTKKCLELHPKCKIISIEPNVELFNKLSERFDRENVIVISDLVSEKNGEEIDFYISNADTISTASVDWIENSRFSKNYKWSSAIKKQTINLDFLIEKYGNPDLIKIDVEGYELEVIKGLNTKQKDLCFEWAEEQYDNINKSCEHLYKIGYRDFGFIYGDDYLKKPEKYSSWNNCEIHKDINSSRKDKWGMIWVK